MGYSIKKIKEHNTGAFLADIRSVSCCMVYATQSEMFMRVSKSDVMKEAEQQLVTYSLSDRIFKNRKLVMVIE
jgi:hypothetical protein